MLYLGSQGLRCYQKPLTRLQAHWVPQSPPEGGRGPCVALLLMGQWQWRGSGVAWDLWTMQAQPSGPTVQADAGRGLLPNGYGARPALGSRARKQGLP